MKLSKYVPAKTVTVYFNWCKKDFLVMTPRIREIRSKCRNPMNICYWCRHKFLDGEMMALAQPAKGPNKTLCQTCAGELLSHLRLSPLPESGV